MPEQPTLDPSAFAPSSSCETCHPDHYGQWQQSMHAYAMVDPVFRALVGVRQADYGGEQDQFCTQCHSAIATRGGEIVDGFSFDDLSPIALEGIGCESCHKIAEVVRSHNSGHRLDPGGPLRGPITDPQLESATHEAETADFFKESRFCGGCHDVVEVSGLNLERPYGEWLESPAVESGQTCQSCHMPSRQGSATPGGPMRTLHDHRFIGVDIPLLDDFVDREQRAGIASGVAELLDGSASLGLSAQKALTPGEQIDVVVTVQNQIAGHNLPTGSTFIRELWLEVIARDGQGRLLYETGTFDDNGDLRHHFSEVEPYGDSDLLQFGSTLIDQAGNPTLFPWRGRRNALHRHPTGLRAHLYAFRSHAGRCGWAYRDYGATSLPLPRPVPAARTGTRRAHRQPRHPRYRQRFGHRPHPSPMKWGWAAALALPAVVAAVLLSRARHSPEIEQPSAPTAIPPGQDLGPPCSSASPSAWNRQLTLEVVRGRGVSDREVERAAPASGALLSALRHLAVAAGNHAPPRGRKSRRRLAAAHRQGARARRHRSAGDASAPTMSRGRDRSPAGLRSSRCVNSSPARLPRWTCDCSCCAASPEPRSPLANLLPDLRGLTLGSSSGEELRECLAIDPTAPPAVLIGLDAVAARRPGTIDVTLPHELGHVLGLSHVTDPQLLMAVEPPTCVPLLPPP